MNKSAWEFVYNLSDHLTICVSYPTALRVTVFPGISNSLGTHAFVFRDNNNGLNYEKRPTLKALTQNYALIKNSFKNMSGKAVMCGLEPPTAVLLDFRMHSKQS